MHARAHAIALVERAGVSVLGARGPGRQRAGVVRFVADIVAFDAAGAGVAAVHRARAAAAVIGAVAEQGSVARGAVRRHGTRAGAAAPVARGSGIAFLAGVDDAVA